MNFIKRALASLIRRPGKNAILLLVVFLLGNVMAGAVSAKQAIRSTQQALYKSIPAISTIFIDTETAPDFYKESTENDGDEGGWKYDVSPEVLQKAGALPYVEFYDYGLSAQVYSSTLQLCEHPTIEGLIGTAVLGSFAPITLRGGQDPAVFDIRDGSIRLVEGRTFTQEEMNSQSYVTLISKDLAEKNNLTVGSKVTLENLVFHPPTESNATNEKYFSYENVFAKQTMDFTVIGLYEVVEQPLPRDQYDAVMVEAAYYQRLNRFYVSNPVASAQATLFIDQTKQIDPRAVSMYSPVDSILFVMKNATYLKEFRETVEPMLADVPLTVNDTGEMLELVIAPMRTFDWIASLVLYISMGATILILSLLVLLFLRDRRHEIGIYRSLGERKGKVVGQILLEVAAVALVGITLSLFSGNQLSESLSQKLLTDQVAAYEEKQIERNVVDGLVHRGYIIDVTSEDLLETYQVSLDGSVILLFYAVGMGTAALSTLLPVLYILMLKPRKTLL